MPSAFTGPLSLTQIDADWRLWRLNEPLLYEVGALGSGRLIEVPAGFVTDGATVPRLLWSLLPAWGTYSRAAAVHDYLCKSLPHRHAATRLAADRIFLDAMKVCGTGRLVRWIMYLAVRSFAIARGLT